MVRIVRILSVVAILALLLGNGAITPTAATADEEVINLPPIELPEKGNPKLDSQLNQLVNAQTRGEATGFAQQSNIELVDGTVRVIIESEPGQIETATKAVSASGVFETNYRNLLQVVVPIAQLTALADTPSIRLVSLPRYPLLDVISEGTALINADEWQTANYTGAGVKIAILDMGFTGYLSLLGTELPNSVTTQSFFAGSNIEGYTAHGTASAEIIYDIAPDAQLYLVNFGTVVEMGNAVNWLIAQQVDVISASFGFFLGGPGDGTGPINQMVDAARAAGILWSAAIGNSAQRHWQGNFVDTYDSDGLHEFSQSPFDEGNTITVNSGDTIDVDLKWDDTWGASANDYDLLLFNNTGSLVAWSFNIQDGNDYPIEWLSYTATYTGAYNIAIGTLGSPAVVNFHLYSYRDDLQYQVASSSLAIPADSPNVMTVGAVPWDNPTTLEPFSSQGPTTDGRVKPDLVAPDGVTSATYSPFFGTSASAPYAAGAAALVKQHYPSYTTPAQIQSFLESRAVPLGTAGKDNLYGSGRLNLRFPGVKVSINAPDEVASGDNFTATVGISQVENFDAANYDVSFDPTVLEIIDLDPATDNVSIGHGHINGTEIPIDLANISHAGTGPNDPTVITLVQNVPGLIGANGTGYLAVLNFHIIGSPGDSSNITLSNGTLGDIYVEEIAATWLGDSIQVVAGGFWSVPMTAATATEGSNPNLAFGTNANATDGFEFGIDWDHAPPPGTPKFDAYFQIADPDHAALDEDYRAPAASIQWTLYTFSTSENITLTWDVSAIPSELSAYMNTGISTVNMRTQSSVVLPAGSYTILISVSSEVAVQIPLKVGWNMVSLPVTPANNSVSSLFPTVGGRAYWWNPATKSYGWGTTIEPGKGYFVSSAADTTVTILGIPVLNWTVNISPGWNMIGSVMGTVSFTAPQDNPDGSVLPRAYWWNPATKSYGWGTTIEPGKGYFVSAGQNCTLTLSTP